VNFIAHGRRTCIARTPACERCPVLRLCPYGMRVLGMPGEGAY
jgi:endonuclease III